MKREYLETHVAVNNQEKRVLSLKATFKQVHDRKVLPELINDMTIKNNKIIIDTIIMDCFYDNNKNFQFLSFKEILPAIIKVRNDWSCKKYQSSRQKQGCKKYRKITYSNAGKKCTILSEMDGRRNCLLLYQKNIWTICFRYSI